MRTPLTARTLTAVPLVILLAVACAGCTYSDDTELVSNRRVAPDQAKPDAAASLHPPIQADAADGYVHEYY